MQALLDDLAVEVEKGNTESVGYVVERILNRPHNVRRNLYSAIEYIGASKRQPAREAVGRTLKLCCDRLLGHKFSWTTCLC